MNMKRNDEGQMVLNDKQFEVTALRDLLVQQGSDPVSAAEAALKSYKGQPSKEFVEWLSQGMLTKADGEVAPVTTQPEPANSGS